MKLIEHFDTFMADVVNLNATRFQQLESSIETIKDVIKDSAWEPKIRYFASQGSWAHKTIIKPVSGKAFDADLLVFVKPVEGWTAKQYISSLKKVFSEHGTYKSKVRRYSHCVTIEYAGERKIDIAPCVVDRDSVSRFEVCNYDLDKFELSDPAAYTQWLIDRNGWVGKNGLRKVTRLLKYLRDIKRTFSCPSVLFTTIIGERIVWLDSLNISDFSDLPISLKTIVGRLDDWLQANPDRPTVTNPVLSSEVFSDLWDDARYSNFRDKIHTYREWIDDAFDEADRDESIGKWQRVFGDDFAKDVVIEKAARISEDAVKFASGTALTSRGFTGDLVALFKQYGRRALPSNFDRLPHKHRPRWKKVAAAPFSIQIVASRHAKRGGYWIDSPASGAPLTKGQWLHFQALTHLGTALGGEYEVQWRVMNTDREASKANQLRGEFIGSNEGQSRWESLAYRGVHTVEAFVIRKSDQLLVAQSDPFYVVIE